MGMALTIRPTLRPTHRAALALLAAGTMTTPVQAQDPWSILLPAAVPHEPGPTSETTAAQNGPEPDWSLLDTSTSATPSASRLRASPSGDGSASLWTSQNKPDGSAALSVKQPLLPFWDTRIGADLNVATRPSSMTTSEMLREKYGPDGSPTQSNGTAWAAMTAPGVGTIWDKTAIEARLDPGQDQSKLATTLSKAVPLGGNQYSLTLQNGYNVVQQAGLPAIGFNGRPTRSYETDQSARLSLNDTGTSLVAGQKLSSSDDKWLRRIGAEQKLFDGVSINGSIGETPQGAISKSLTAGFKRSW